MAVWQQRGPQRWLSSRPALQLLTGVSDPSVTCGCPSCLPHREGEEELVENDAFKVKFPPFDFWTTCKHYLFKKIK